MLLGNRAVRHIADKCHARCNTDARAQFFFCGQGGDRLHQCEAGLNGALRVVFVRVRIAEIYHRTVAMMPRDKAVEAGNGFSNTAPVAGDDCAKIFGIEFAESAVDPTRSQNSTVSWRRSIGREFRVIGTTAGEPARNSLPQSPQNLFRAGFAVPQARQRRTTAAPHRPQNFLCFGTSAAQFVQCIRTSTDNQ